MVGKYVEIEELNTVDEIVDDYMVKKCKTSWVQVPAAPKRMFTVQVTYDHEPITAVFQYT